MVSRGGCEYINPNYFSPGTPSTKSLLFRYLDNNDIEAVQNLLKSGTDPNEKDKSGESALMRATHRGYYQIATQLVKHGADVNSKDNSPTCISKFRFDSILMIACRGSGDLKYVQFLLKNGANVNESNRWGGTALMLAVFGHTIKIEIVKVLLENGADPNSKCKNHSTALMRASQRGNVEVVKLLLENNADPNIKTSNRRSIRSPGYDFHEGGRSAIFDVIVRSELQGLELVKILIENGADLSTRNANNESPFGFSCKREKRYETSLYLLELGGAENVEEKHIEVYKIKKRRKFINKSIRIIKRVLFPDDAPIIAEIIAQYAYGLKYLQNYIDKHELQEMLSWLEDEPKRNRLISYLKHTGGGSKPVHALKEVITSFCLHDARASIDLNQHE